MICAGENYGSDGGGSGGGKIISDFRLRNADLTRKLEVKMWPELI
jgi:hypothetical protein